MALDETVAGASSDTYATLAEADAYVLEVESSTWDSLTDTEKENFLKRAARIIDRYFWDGLGKYDTWTVTAGQPNGQRREFPRATDVDGAGDPFIPPEVVECASAVAVALAEGATDTGTSDAVTKRLKAGSFEIEFDTSDGSVSAVTTDDVVREILAHRMATSARTY